MSKFYRCGDVRYPGEMQRIVIAKNSDEAYLKAFGAELFKKRLDMPLSAVETPVEKMTIGELLENLPWGLNDYSELYDADKAPHRDYRHAAMHLAKAGGMLLVTPEEMDHDPTPPQENSAAHKDAAKRLADVVIVAMRMANTHPTGKIDLAKAIEERLLGKKNEEQERKLSGR